MRINVYAEELTDRVELVKKEIDGKEFTAIRFYTYLPVTVGGREGKHENDGPSVYPSISGEATQVRGPFIHREGDDDSSAFTIWGKRDFRGMLRKALALLDEHYKKNEINFREGDCG